MQVKPRDTNLDGDLLSQGIWLLFYIFFNIAIHSDIYELIWLKLGMAIDKYYETVFVASSLSDLDLTQGQSRK